jgi:hypothetical protein
LGTKSESAEGMVLESQKDDVIYQPIGGYKVLQGGLELQEAIIILLREASP